MVRFKGCIGKSLADYSEKGRSHSGRKAELLGVCTDKMCSDICFNCAMGGLTGKEQE